MVQLTHYRNEKKAKGEYNWVGPLLAGGRLLLANSQGELVSVSPADGSVTSTIDIKAPVTLAPVIANNMLFILDDKGNLSAYR